MCVVIITRAKHFRCAILNVTISAHRERDTERIREQERREELQI